MRTNVTAETVRMRRLERVRRTLQPKRVGRLMYRCPICRKYSYDLNAHRCGRTMGYPG